MVHVNRQIRNHQEIAVNADQLRPDLIFPLHGNAARDRKRPVKPGCAEHAAVALHIQFDIVSFDFHIRILFDFKRRRIAVTRNNLEAVRLARRKPERNQC